MRELTISFNRFREIPAVVFTWSKLENILACDNQIGAIDVAGLKRLPMIATLDLQNNDIMQVPPELGLIESLRWDSAFFLHFFYLYDQKKTCNRQTQCKFPLRYLSLYFLIYPDSAILTCRKKTDGCYRVNINVQNGRHLLLNSWLGTDWRHLGINFKTNKMTFLIVKQPTPLYKTLYK